MDVDHISGIKVKPRIGIFLASLGGGGAERAMVNLARGLVERGYKVDLLLKQAVGKYFSDIPTNVQIVDLKAGRMIATLPPLIRYINHQHPDVLLSVLDIPNLLNILANLFSKHKTKTALSFQYHGFVGNSVERALGKLLYPAADIVIASSMGVAKFLGGELNIDINHINAIYNPVIPSDLEVLANEEISHPWFSDTELPIILGVGRLEPQKDFETLLKAFYEVRKVIPARLLILGEGSQHSLLKCLANELGIESDVSMPGFVQNPYSYMRKSSVFVLSSVSEGFGNVVAEALACGCPVVSTDCPSGPREILRDGDFGSLVPVGDVHVMAEAIMSALKYRAKLVDMDWLNQFTIDAATINYLKVFGL